MYNTAVLSDMFKIELKKGSNENGMFKLSTP